MNWTSDHPPQHIVNSTSTTAHLNTKHHGFFPFTDQSLAGYKDSGSHLTFAKQLFGLLTLPRLVSCRAFRFSNSRYGLLFRDFRSSLLYSAYRSTRCLFCDSALLDMPLGYDKDAQNWNKRLEPLLFAIWDAQQITIGFSRFLEVIRENFEEEPSPSKTKIQYLLDLRAKLHTPSQNLRNTVWQDSLDTGFFSKRWSVHNTSHVNL